MKKLFTPFEEISKIGRLGLFAFWAVLSIFTWMVMTSGETHLFPTIGEVVQGLKDLYANGLVVHIVSSLSLCAKAIFIAVLVSLSFVYLSTVPIFKPVSVFVSKLRYLPLTGISFYITTLLEDAREIQVWILVIFMTTFLITSLLSTIKDIPAEDFDHARALGYGRWAMLWEVVIKGRFDYVLEMVRQNLAIVWMMLVTVESTVAASGGLGLLIQNSDKFMNHGRIIALQLVILFLGLTLDFFLEKIRKIAFRYSKM